MIIHIQGGPHAGFMRCPRLPGNSMELYDGATDRLHKYVYVTREYLTYGGDIRSVEIYRHEALSSRSITGIQGTRDRRRGGLFSEFLRDSRYGSRSDVMEPTPQVSYDALRNLYTYEYPSNNHVGWFDGTTA